MVGRLGQGRATAGRSRCEPPTDRWPGTFALPERGPLPAPTPPVSRDAIGASSSLFGRLALGQRSWAVGLLLYVLALVPLLGNLAGYPPVAFNWEEYSAEGIFAFLDQPSLSHFAPTDGLMTDSGHSPLVVLPVALAWQLGGVGLLGLRLPIALLAAGAVPLCWLFGRRVVGAGPALLGAALLALSPVFALYGRTGTLVGLSLVPALTTALLLRRLLDRPTALRLGLLQLALLSLGWAYGPIRFLWPIAVAAVAAELLLRPGLRHRFAFALLVTTATLPLFLWGVARWEEPDATTTPTPLTALRAYYNGRGEHALTDDGTGVRWSAIVAVIEKNARDSRDLLLDRETAPVPLSFWNAQGRLHEGWLMPLLALGLGWTGWRAWRDPGARLILLLVAGFWLPLLLTSNVHVGRLIYVVPLLALLTARGAATWAAGIGLLCARAYPWLRATLSAAAPTARVVAALLLLLAVGWRGWQDYTAQMPHESMARGVALLEEHAASADSLRPTILLLTLSDPQGEGNTDLAPEDPAAEALGVAAYRLRLDRTYRLVNITAGAAPPHDDAPGALPSLVYGGNPAAALSLDQLCAATYFAPEPLAPAVALRVAALACPALPDVLPLPR